MNTQLPPILTPELAQPDVYMPYCRITTSESILRYRRVISDILFAIKNGATVSLEYDLHDGINGGRESKIIVPYSIHLQEVIGTPGKFIRSQNRKVPGKPWHGPQVQTLVHQLVDSQSRENPQTFEWKTLAIDNIYNTQLWRLPDDYVPRADYSRPMHVYRQFDRDVVIHRA